MRNPTWLFEPTSGMGGATGGAFTNPLLGTGMEPAAVLAREAIQNSVDAREGGEKVRIDFRRVVLVGNEKAAFINAMGLDPALTSHRPELKLPQGACLDHLYDMERPLNLLFIEDYGTFGLHGKTTKSKSHFFRLLKSLGDDTKASESDGSGGSYGFGKSVYSSNSRIHTIVAYSVFDPELSGVPEKNHARLMGCSYLNQHELDAVEYTGRAWLGEPSSDGTVVEPLVDGEAHEFAASLGFRPRGENQRGTSLLIVDCDVDCDLLRDSVEEWWWPRLLDHELGLDVTLSDQGVPLAPPRPRKRTDLQPFIECFDMAIGRSKPVGAHQKAGPFNKLQEIPLGCFGYAVLDDPGTDERLRAKLGRIALIRKPRMVIEYMAIGGALPLHCVGVFVAAPEVDNELKRSEPASHDKWDDKSGRLSELAPPAREIVHTILQRLKQGFRNFARDAAPQPPKQELRLRLLEKMLGGLFKPPTATRGGEGAGASDPISIHFLESPHVVSDGELISTNGTFRIALADDSPREAVRVRLKVNCLIQEDDRPAKEDPVPVKLRTDDLEKAYRDSLGGCVEFELRREFSPVFAFKSEPYSVDWTACVSVEVEEIQ